MKNMNISLRLLCVICLSTSLLAFSMEESSEEDQETERLEIETEKIAKEMAQLKQFTKELQHIRQESREIRANYGNDFDSALVDNLLPLVTGFIERVDERYRALEDETDPFIEDTRNILSGLLVEARSFEDTLKGIRE